MERNALEIFRAQGGPMRMSEALASGIARHRLYTLLGQGLLERVSRGVYRLADLPPIGNPDLVTVTLRAPNAVICLVSALAHHELTTQIPRLVSIALPRRSRPPVLEHPPLEVHLFSEPAFSAGIEKHSMDGVNVRIYSPEKTLADCFKFRNKLGLDVVLEALRLYRERQRFDVENLLRYGRICRVEKVMQPYLEALA